MIKRILLAACTAAIVSGVAVAQTAVPPMPDDIKAIRASGIGLSVADLERSRKFYMDVLGFKIAARAPATGEPVEYLLSLNGDLRNDTLVVIRKSDKIQPGATSFGRILMTVPNGRKMAERVQAAGYPVARIVDGTNFITDPDGYSIELYQRPAAPAR